MRKWLFSILFVLPLMAFDLDEDITPIFYPKKYHRFHLCNPKIINLQDLTQKEWKKAIKKRHGNTVFICTQGQIFSLSFGQKSPNTEILESLLPAQKMEVKEPFYLYFHEKSAFFSRDLCHWQSSSQWLLEQFSLYLQIEGKEPLVLLMNENQN